METKKVLIYVGVGIIAVVLAVSVLAGIKDAIAKIVIERGVEAVTGLPLRMGGFRVGLMNPVVDIKDLRLFNPKGYPDKIMLEMPEIYVDYDLPAIVKGKVHLEDLRINLRSFTVVKNADGEVNLNALKSVQRQQQAGEKAPAPKKKGKAPSIQIDNFELAIGKLIYKDYSRGGKPVVQEFNINIAEKYQNITSPYKLVSLIVVRALTGTAVARLTNFDLNGLKGSVSDTLAGAQKIAMDSVTKAQAQLAETTRKTKETVKKTTDTLKGKADDIKQMIRLPFGSKEE